MIHREVLQEILKAKQDGGFLYPYYGKYSIAEIPASILKHFGVSGTRPTLPFDLAGPGEAEHLILFFIDGLGFDHFTEFANFSPFFGRLRQKAQVYPLTSVFPSTTPAALTTFHTGLTPEEHGLPEWTVYFEELDRIVETLPFRAHLTPGRDTLLTGGGEAQMLYEGTTVYRQLEDAHIPSYVFSSDVYSESAYSRMTQEGSTVIPFADGADLFEKLAKHIKSLRGKAYTFVNWAEIDSMEHAFGPGSQQHRDAVATLSAYFEERLLPRLTPEDADRTLLMLSSDHGQSAIRDEDILYLNEYIDLEESYVRSTTGKPIFPTGAPHDVFLNIDPSKANHILAYLRQKLAGRAEVLSIDEAFTKGLFGFAQASDRFKKRVGNILILPYEGYHVWYRHMPQMYFGQRGIHGGLSRDEMLVPLIFAPLKELLS